VACPQLTQVRATVGFWHYVRHETVAIDLVHGEVDTVNRDGVAALDVGKDVRGANAQRSVISSDDLSNLFDDPGKHGHNRIADSPLRFQIFTPLSNVKAAFDEALDCGCGP